MRTMGGFYPDDSYQNKEQFFARHLHERYVIWGNYLRRHLKTSEEILSVASGRCINELQLLNNGYAISCSDLERFPAYDASVQLFGAFPFYVLDVLNEAPEKEFDSIFCLSAIYLFNADDLGQFFRKINMGLRKNGRLFLDGGGPKDNLFSLFWHGFYLPIEYRLYAYALKIIKRKEVAVVTLDHGFRHTNEDIIKSGERAGFEFIGREDFDFLNEFLRSVLLRNIINRSPVARRFLSILGRRTPYIRMFEFRKT